MASENKKALVFSILEFLKKSCDDGTIGQDDQEGIEGKIIDVTDCWGLMLCTILVAMQCIGEAFGVDPTDQAQQEAYSTKPANLLSIFEVYLKTKSKSKGQVPVKTSLLLVLFFLTYSVYRHLQQRLPLNVSIFLTEL